MRNLLPSALDETTLGTPVVDLLDVWHLLEKLAPTAQVAFGDAAGRTALARWRAALLNRAAAPDHLSRRRADSTSVWVITARPRRDHVPDELS